MSNKVFNYTLHRKMWHELASNPDATKTSLVADGFFTQEELQELGESACVACEYACKDGKFDNCKDDCPLEYTMTNRYEKNFCCLGGLYEMYQEAKYFHKIAHNEKTRENVIKYARMIRDLKPRQGVRIK